MEFQFNSGKGKHSAEMKAMTSAEINRYLSSINGKIMRIKNRDITELYLLQSTEMIVNKITLFFDMFRRKDIDMRTIMAALNGEFHRQALIIFAINTDHEIDPENLSTVDRAFVDKIDDYLSKNQMDLQLGLHEITKPE